MHMCSYMWSWHLRLDETHKTRSVVNDVVQSFEHENHVSGFQIVRPFWHKRALRFQLPIHMVAELKNSS